MNANEAQYLELLSQTYPTAEAAAAEIIRLNAALNLPKAPEFFASDIHGEHDAFAHILKNGSGSVRAKIEAAFGDEMTAEEKRSLATLIYYPAEKMELVLPEVDEDTWFADILLQLLAVCKQSAAPYAHFEVYEALPEEFADIIEELLFDGEILTHPYRAAILEGIIRTGQGAAFVEALCLLIQRLAVEHLHMLGDVYDRGPAPQEIMEELMAYHSVDVQWGNHDMVWMGAALGQRGCIANVLRICARYGNLSILEDDYGINLRPLASFAMSAYADDPCVAFNLKGDPGLTPAEREINVKIQKAMAILQFKVEAQLIDENPCFGLDDRKQLHLIDHDKGTIVVDGIEYELKDRVFPTVDLDDPYRLTDEEEQVMQGLVNSFVNNEKMQRHMRFFLENGGLYKICNGNLLLHACVPLNEDGTLKEANIYGETYKGRALYDVLDRYVHDAFDAEDPADRKRGADLMWWMWLGPASPLFAKSKMATFELYLIEEKAARKEVKNSFYTLLNDEAVMAGIFEDFGMDPQNSRVICGHVPVKVKDGEDPIKGGGKVLTIDGGFSPAYQKTTGIAGFTLVSDANGIFLDAHQPLESAEAAVAEELDIFSERRVVWQAEEPVLVADTDAGEELRHQIADLEMLLDAYELGLM